MKNQIPSSSKEEAIFSLGAIISSLEKKLLQESVTLQDAFKHLLLKIDETIKLSRAKSPFGKSEVADALVEFKQLLYLDENFYGNSSVSYPVKKQGQDPAAAQAVVDANFFEL